MTSDRTDTNKVCPSPPGKSHSGLDIPLNREFIDKGESGVGKVGEALTSKSVP